MKIAVFGDSFADTSNRTYLPFVNKSWPNRLLQNYDVDNFAEAGSGLLHSVEIINRSIKIEDYDKIIFCASQFIRQRLNEETFNTSKQQVGGYKHFSVTFNEKNSRYDEAGRKLHSNNARIKYGRLLRNFTKYFYIEHDSKYLNYLVLKDIKERLGDKLLLLKCFDDIGKYAKQFSYDHIVDNKIALWSICEYERRISPELLDAFKVCHLVSEHHDMLYKKIVSWIETGNFSLTKKDIITDLKHTYKDTLEWKEFIKKHPKFS